MISLVNQQICSFLGLLTVNEDDRSQRWIICAAHRACDSVLEPYFKTRAIKNYTLINCSRAKSAMILSLKSLIILIINHTEYFSSLSFSLFCVNKSYLLHREEQCLLNKVGSHEDCHLLLNTEISAQALGFKIQFCSSGSGQPTRWRSQHNLTSTRKWRTKTVYGSTLGLTLLMAAQLTRPGCVQ